MGGGQGIVVLAALTLAATGAITWRRTHTESDFLRRLPLHATPRHCIAVTVFVGNAAVIAVSVAQR